jgi:hypothetical protein
MKRVLTVPIVLISLGLAACGGGETKTVTVGAAPASTTTAETVATTTELDDAPDTAEDAAESSEDGTLKRIAIGGAASDDDITFKATSFKRVYSIAVDEYSDGPILPAKGAKLYTAQVTWKNNTDASLGMFCGGGGALLFDEDGRQFDLDSESMLDIPGNETCGDDVQPGFKQTETLVFRTPKTATPNVLLLWNSEDEYDGSDPDTAVAVRLR